MTAQHTDGLSILDTEPVAVSTAVQGVLGLAVAAGWLTVPSTTVDAAASGVAALLAIGANLWARRKVAPVAPVAGTVDAHADAALSVLAAQPAEQQPAASSIDQPADGDHSPSMEG